MKICYICSDIIASGEDFVRVGVDINLYAHKACLKPHTD